ncbi:hypothetical protein ONZ45_g11320 [Pleurotus djamor]|nr:hypothetical protein ONZ45_g11320 [Pleurotus djamor]
MLTEVRGIGRWTVDMFAIFSLRRPDIMPVGDLGVQRGVARWFLDLHSPSYSFSISPDKLAGSQVKEADTTADDSDDDDALPVPDSKKKASVPAADASSVPPGAVPATPMPDGSMKSVASLPPPLTPATTKRLTALDGPAPTLPKTLTVAELKGRLDGKKKIKGALLTPQEMEELTDSWKPYRSLGVYYMWSLADGSAK